jgi:hypothetical protein
MNDKERPEEEIKIISLNVPDPAAAVDSTGELSDGDLESVSGGGDSGNSTWNPS